jgi:hypothetical protein
MPDDRLKKSPQKSSLKKWVVSSVGLERPELLGKVTGSEVHLYFGLLAQLV